MESLIAQDLTHKAFQEVNYIFEKADKAKNEYQMLKSAIFLSRLESELDEDYSLTTLSRLKSLIPSLTGGRKAIGYALIGNFYREYYLLNKWNITINSTGKLDKENIHLWDEDTFKEAVCNNLLLSINYLSGKTIKAPVSKYLEILDKGNMQGRRLRPFLLDILHENAFWNIHYNISKKQVNLFNNSLLYGCSNEFIKLVDSLDKNDRSYWNLEIARRLTLSHIDSNSDIRASIDLRRMEILKKSRLFNNDLYLDGIKKLAFEYLYQTPLATEFLSEAATILIDRQENTSAKELCDLAVSLYPDSLGGVECQNMIYEIQRKEVSLSLWTDLIPDTINLGQLNIRNVDKIYFTAVRSQQEYYLSGKKLIRFLNSMEKEAEWEQLVDDPGDYNPHSSYFTTPPLRPGNYYILARVSPEFDTTSVVSYLYCRCTIIGFVYQTYSNNRVEGFVINQKTGQPIIGCEYKIIQKPNTWDSETASKEVLKGHSDENGYISVGPLPSGSHEIILNYTENSSLFNLYLPQRITAQTVGTAKLFTDRFSYRPGDKVFFKGIVYYCNGYSIGKTKQGQHVKVIIRDTNWQETDVRTLVTDKFGGVSGEFLIPSNALAGQFTLQISNENETFISNRTINIEYYKHPLFTVTFCSPADSLKLEEDVEISGSARFISGFPVSGAKVNYRVVRENIVPYWRFWADDNSVTELLQGETITTNKGFFSFSFFSEPDYCKKPDDEIFFRYHIFVEITDISKVCVSRQTSLSIGWKESHIDLLVPNIVLKEAVIDTSLSNLEGKVLEGTIQLKVEKLTIPTEPVIYTSGLISIDPVFNKYESLKKSFPLYSLGMNEDPVFWDVEKEVFKKNITSGEKVDKSQIKLALENGVYRVTAESWNEEGEIKEIRHFTVFNPGSNEKVCNKILCAIPAEETYCVGDIATVLVECGLKNTNVIYFIENRFGLFSCGSIFVSEETKQLKIPVTEDMTGGFTVKLSAVLERVSVCDQFHLNVPFTEKELKVSFITFRDLLKPETEETWRLKIEENNGYPAEAALLTSLFDASLDAHGTNEWLFSPWREASLNSSPLVLDRERLSSSYQDTINYKLFSSEKPYFAGIIPTSPLFIDNSSSPTLYRTGNTLNIFYESSLSTPFVANPKKMPMEETQSDNILFGISDNNTPVKYDNYQTAFFYPDLVTNKNGETEISFRVPEIPTEWNFKGLAYTTNLKSFCFLKRITTSKELMVKPNLPRFFREGDTILFQSKISNLTADTIRANVRLEFQNTLDEEPVNIIQDKTDKTVIICAKSSNHVSFKLIIPNGLKSLNYLIKASSEKHTDKQCGSIPVISNKTSVVKPLGKLFNDTKRHSFVLNNLTKHDIRGDEEKELTLEFFSSPIWYAILSLPSLSYKTDPSNVNLYHRFFANRIANFLTKKYPAIIDTLKKYSGNEHETVISSLEKNQKKKQTHIIETRWVEDIENEYINIREAVEYLDHSLQDTLVCEYTNELIKAQSLDGGWAWIKSYYSSPYITGMILRGMADLQRFSVVDTRQQTELRISIARAVHYLDREYLNVFLSIEGKSQNVNFSTLNYLLSRYVFKYIPFNEGSEESFNFFHKKAAEMDFKEADLYTKTALAHYYILTGLNELAGKIVLSILDSSVNDKENQRYWQYTTQNFRWHDSPIVCQSQIISALVDVGGFEKEVEEAKKWLLREKLSTPWSIATETAGTIWAIVVSEGRDPFQGKINLDIKLRQQRVAVSDISIDKKILLVKSGKDGIFLNQITKETEIRVGERIKIKFTLSVERNLEYIRIKDFTAACFEPVNKRSGMIYSTNGDISYYIDYENSSTSFFIESLDKGSYTIEYDLFVSHAGSFTNDATTVQCIYAPKLREITNPFKIKVKP